MEAMRALKRWLSLKRRLSDIVYHQMITDARRQTDPDRRHLIRDQPRLPLAAFVGHAVGLAILKRLFDQGAMIMRTARISRSIPTRRVTLGAPSAPRLS
jgi:hypothetical protein